MSLTVTIPGQNPAMAEDQFYDDIFSALKGKFDFIVIPF